MKYVKHPERELWTGQNGTRYADSSGVGLSVYPFVPFFGGGRVIDVILTCAKGNRN